MRLLLLSNSTLPGEPYLGWPRPHITEFLGERKRIAFVPFAAVSFSMDEYARMTQGAFAEMGHELFSLHTEADKVKALMGADAVAVGGGNTFQLLRTLYSTELLRAIRVRVMGGMPYIGWSAGSNVACPTIMTTNDMPITEVPTMRAMGLVPFQINPHYTDARLPGHGGESRDQRIAEYLALNQRSAVVGLREGALLNVNEELMSVEGAGMRLFRSGQEPKDIPGGTALRTALTGA
ncbi:MAG: dipeptidase PepE [Flavobacteriales bacterium]